MRCFRISSCLWASSSVLFFKATVVVVMFCVFESTWAMWLAISLYLSFSLCSALATIGSLLRVPDLLAS